MLLYLAMTARSALNEYPVSSQKHQKSLMPHWMLHVSDDDGSSHAPQLDQSFRTCTHRYSIERRVPIVRFTNVLKSEAHCTQRCKGKRRFPGTGCQFFARRSGYGMSGGCMYFNYYLLHMIYNLELLRVVALPKRSVFQTKSLPQPEQKHFNDYAWAHHICRGRKKALYMPECDPHKFILVGRKERSVDKRG